MDGYFSYRNEVTEYYREIGINPVFEGANTAIVAGSMNNLLTRQLERGVTLERDGGDVKVMVNTRQPLSDDWPEWESRDQVRVIALLGIEPAPLGGFGSITVEGRVGPNAATDWEAVTGTGLYYEPGDPRRDVDRVNRIMTLPWGPDARAVANYLQYRITIVRLDESNNPLTVSLGGVWVGNAVEFPKSVDADWTLGAVEAGSLSTSRGGQVYARRAPVRRTLRMSLGRLDQYTAYGIGAYYDEWGRQQGPDWMSDAQAHLGANGACIAIPRSQVSEVGQIGDRNWIKRAALYGHLNRPIEITHRAGQFYSSLIDMMEEL